MQAMAKTQNKSHRMMFRIAPDQYALLERAAEDEDRKPADMVRYILSRYLRDKYPAAPQEIVNPPDGKRKTASK